MIYFFDCAAEYPNEETKEEAGATEYFTLAKEALKNRLRNTVADQAYSAENKAGYTGTFGTDIGAKHAGSDIWAHGWWAYGNKSIDYAFDLEAGEYRVSTGFQEWWSTSRPSKIEVSVNGEELNSMFFTLAGSDTALQKTLDFVLKEDATVTVSVSKIGSADPVMSWIAVMRDTKDAVDPEPTPEPEPEPEPQEPDLSKYTPAKASIKALKATGGKKLKITWKKVKNASGYEVQVSTNKKFKKIDKKASTKKGSKTTVTIKKLKKNKKYYVQVRAYRNVKIDGKTYKVVGKWSKIKTSKKIK